MKTTVYYSGTDIVDRLTAIEIGRDDGSGSFKAETWLLAGLGIPLQAGDQVDTMYPQGPDVFVSTYRNDSGREYWGGILIDGQRILDWLATSPETSIASPGSSN